MASSIDNTVPATNADLLSSPVRTNFGHARTEILALQTTTGDATTVAGLRAVVEAAVPDVVDHNSATLTLTKASHQGKLIYVRHSGTVSITVDNSTDFDAYGSCEIVNKTGAVVTFVATATINRIGSKPLTLPANGRATLMREATADVYLLTGEMA
jgi:hypothetical protein